MRVGGYPLPDNAVEFVYGFLSAAEWREWVYRELGTKRQKQRDKSEIWHGMQHYLFR